MVFGNALANETTVLIKGSTTVTPNYTDIPPSIETGTGNIKLLHIDGGSFNREGHTVTVSDFYMGETEVTQAQYVAVMNTNPSYFTEDDANPVEQVSWYEAPSDGWFLVAQRIYYGPVDRYYDVGFRVVRSVRPCPLT